MKNLKKLDRKSLRNVNGGNTFCNLECEIGKVCGVGCYGLLVCVPRGHYIPDNC